VYRPFNSQTCCLTCYPHRCSLLKRDIRWLRMVTSASLRMYSWPVLCPCIPSLAQPKTSSPASDPYQTPACFPDSSTIAAASAPSPSGQSKTKSPDGLMNASLLTDQRRQTKMLMNKESYTKPERQRNDRTYTGLMAVHMELSKIGSGAGVGMGGHC
jgi:hypothetical protein